MHPAGTHPHLHSFPTRRSSDLVGICFSDIKLLRLGGDHPKLYGRDLSREPTRLGHETSITVVAVGEDLRGRFRPGQRSEEHTSELQSRFDLVCRLLLEKKKIGS